MATEHPQRTAPYHSPRGKLSLREEVDIAEGVTPRTEAGRRAEDRERTAAALAGHVQDATRLPATPTYDDCMRMHTRTRTAPDGTPEWSHAMLEVVAPESGPRPVSRKDQLKAELVGRDWLSAPEVANLLDYTTKMVLRHIARGWLEAHQPGGMGAHYRIPAAALRRYLLARRFPAGEIERIERGIDERLAALACAS